MPFYTLICHHISAFYALFTLAWMFFSQREIPKIRWNHEQEMSSVFTLASDLLRENTPASVNAALRVFHINVTFQEAVTPMPGLTRSMTTSLRQSARHWAATRHTCMTASGSSAFTWKMGAFTTRATSVQYGEEREHRGSVVNPICKHEHSP